MSADANTLNEGRATIKRPLSVTVISYLFIVAGSVGFIYHATEFKLERPFHDDVLWVLLVRFLAIVCGIFMLGGSNWARWSLLAWIAYHVGLSAFHSLTQLGMHTLMFGVVIYFLLRTPAVVYFRGSREHSPPG